jgi:hypothetical protein
MLSVMVIHCTVSNTFDSNECRSFDHLQVYIHLILPPSVVLCSWLIPLILPPSVVFLKTRLRHIYIPGHYSVVVISPQQQGALSDGGS